MNSKIQKKIDEANTKIQAEFDKKFTTYKIKVQAIKDGTMENGEFFCRKGRLYDAEFVFETENQGNEEDWYDVKDETYERDRGMKYNCPHGMDADFFSEYFIVIS